MDSSLVDRHLLGMPFARVELRGDAGRDLLSGQGGFGTGAPLSTAKAVRLEGGAGGGDVLRGSDIPVGDDITGSSAPETIAGGAGADRISPSLGNDVVDGGRGSDTQQGLKTITTTENLIGSASSDRLIGDAGRTSSTAAPATTRSRAAAAPTC